MEANWQVDRRFEPQMPEDRAASLRARWTEAVARAKGWATDERTGD
jgi:glycerol kinase